MPNPTPPNSTTPAPASEPVLHLPKTPTAEQRPRAIVARRQARWCFVPGVGRRCDCR